jgi:hypothetical protein
MPQLDDFGTAIEQNGHTDRLVFEDECPHAADHPFV